MKRRPAVTIAVLGSLSLTAATAITACSGGRGDPLTRAVEAAVAESGAEVGFFYRDLATGDTLLVNPDLRMHAASTMKVPIMIQMFRDVDDGILDLDDSVLVHNEFRSIVDGSSYTLDLADDSDSTVYGRVGEYLTLGELVPPMIHTSSNLATNMLVEIVDARRAESTMRGLGADSIAVLRGVEDMKAYEAGLSNTTTARDLGEILTALAVGRAASPPSTAEMIEILEEQHFNAGIPAGLPPGALVAHKTGTITEIHHDAAIVTLPSGDRYVLVVLTRGLPTEAAADRLISDLSRAVYDARYHNR